MNAIQRDVQATAQRYMSGDLADCGKQQESVQIDGVPVLGSLSFDNTDVELVFGGTRENISALFSTLKCYFPNGYPIIGKSFATCIVDGEQKRYKVRQINGDKTNGARLAIGLVETGNTAK